MDDLKAEHDRLVEAERQAFSQCQALRIRLTSPGDPSKDILEAKTRWETAKRKQAEFESGISFFACQ